MNYAQLVENIQTICETTFESAELAMFTQQAEQKIYATVELPALRKNQTGSMTSGNKYLAMPTGMLYVYSLAVIDDNTYYYLLNKDVNFVREAYPNPTDTGIPKHYAIFDQNTFILGPTPNDNYAVELHYGYYPESIVTAGTSWLGDNLDSVLLYGTLVEAYTYMKGEADMMTLYNTKYNEALAMAKRLGDGMERQDAYRSGQYRQAVT